MRRCYDVDGLMPRGFQENARRFPGSIPPISLIYYKFEQT